MWVNPRKRKVWGCPSPRWARRSAAKRAKRDQAGLVRMQRQRKLLQARAHRVPEAPGIGLVLETDHDVE